MTPETDDEDTNRVCGILWLAMKRKQTGDSPIVGLQKNW